MSERAEGRPASSPGQLPADAVDVVVQVTNTLRDYLSTDSSFTPEMAVERVRTLVNSKAGMAAFVSDALRPGEAGAEVVIAKLAETLDQHAPSEETVLALIDIVESPLAVQVYDRGTDRNQTGDAGSWH
jgi:hypothetical protein